MLSMRPPPLAMTTVMYIAITSVIARKMALFAIWRASPTVLHPGAEVLRELADITLCLLVGGALFAAEFRFPSHSKSSGPEPRGFARAFLLDGQDRIHEARAQDEPAYNNAHPSPRSDEHTSELQSPMYLV